MNKEYLYPIIFENCQVVKGFSRSLFCDMQRNSYRFIPNDLYNLLITSKGKTLFEIKAQNNNKYDDIIEENLSLLEREEFIFFTNYPEWFPEISLYWDEPTELTNAIIDIEPDNIHDFDSIWNQLSKIGCEHIQLRSYKRIDLNKIEKIINKIGKQRIISIELIIPYYKNKTDQDLIDFVYKQPRVFSLILHSANKNKTIFISPTQMGNIYLSRNKIISYDNCGKINSDLFNTNVKSYTEAQHYNTCLNRKISIDVEGNIKNCPSMSQSFGNIKDTTLQEALDHPDFKKYWNVKKDDITKCKDCEFRYICTDCRAYLEEPDDMYSAPLKCGYDPYTGEWSEWSENPLKKKAIEFYGMEQSDILNNEVY